MNEAIVNWHKNTGQLPEQIVIYRDGMGGPSLTKMV